jgi:hypothetical protein
VTGDGGVLRGCGDVLQHGLEVLAEAPQRVVVLGGGRAAPVAAQVVGDQRQLRPRQALDDRPPEVDALRPAVGEHERGGGSTPADTAEALGVQPGAVGGDDRPERDPAQGLAQALQLGIGGNRPQVTALRDRGAGEATRGSRREQCGTSQTRAGSARCGHGE